MPTGNTPILTRIKEYFGMSAPEMMKEWKALSDKDKADLREGIENGSLTY